LNIKWHLKSSNMGFIFRQNGHTMKKFATTFVFIVAAHLCIAEDTVAPALSINLTSPLDYQVAQRSTLVQGELIVAGTIVSESKNTLLPDKLEVLVTGKSSFGNLPDQWQPLACDSRVAAFHGKLNLPAGGWYRLEVRAFRQGVRVADAFVEHIGVGEIFVVAGQSNSANYGEEKQATQTGLVASFDGTQWRLAKDPEPGAGGTKGSFMPPFGDEMAGHFHVPIGMVATGIGSTSVREWLPAGTRLALLPPLTRNVVTVGNGQWEASGKIFENFTARMKQLGTNGFRAVLWHQGESDAKQAEAERTLPGGLYRQYLEQLIRDSRKTIGWDASWFVAQVSYHNPGDTASPDIRAAQKSLWDDGIALHGPDTDTLTGDMREKNGLGIHMSAKGLKAHAHLWFEKVSPWLEQQLGETEKAK
jgi:Carbohydrate esterase, sialic acid-specific acetylesterase